MNVYLFPALRMTPGLVQLAFEQTSEHSWDTPTHLERFTPREIVAHLADWEPIMFGRMRQCVESPGSLLVSYDEGKMAVENGYAKWDPQDSLATFKQARLQTLAWLEKLKPEDWACSATHPERGVLTVYDMANLQVCHDVYHIDQLSRQA